MKYKLLRDIRVDIEVCKIMGVSPKEYICELQELLNSLLTNLKPTA